jgi:hypothetical protein
VCRGPGRIQQEIAALIAANPDDAWTPEKKHRVAVTRALRQMELPPLWRTVRLNRSGAEHCLYNAGSLESTKRKYHLAGWPLDSLYLIERVPKDVADARRYDEASPVEKVDIDIGRLQQRTVALKRLGAGRGAFAELAEEMAKLHRRKAELQATQSTVASPSPQGGGARTPENRTERAGARGPGAV